MWTNNEKGVTLLETIIAIVIVVLIITSFYTFFLSSKKTNSQSDTISEATYIAQQEMESIYVLASSGNSSLNTLETNFIQGFLKTSKQTASCSQAPSSDSNEASVTYEFTKTTDPYTIHATVSALCQYEKTGRVQIQVLQQGIVKATVENVYIWK